MTCTVRCRSLYCACSTCKVFYMYNLQVIYIIIEIIIIIIKMNIKLFQQLLFKLIRHFLLLLSFPEILS